MGSLWTTFAESMLGISAHRESTAITLQVLDGIGSPLPPWAPLSRTRLFRVIHSALRAAGAFSEEASWSHFSRRL